jgi:hypothetical protein
MKSLNWHSWLSLLQLLWVFSSAECRPTKGGFFCLP